MKTIAFTLLLSALMLLSGCTQQNVPMIIAHRGASGYATENTLAAVQKAIDLDVDAIEIDIWRTADDSLVVFHDKNTKRLAGDSLVIPQSTYAELRALNLPDDQKIPTIREVLEMLPRNMKIVIELKNCWEPGKAGDNFPELGEILKETGTLKQAVLISFNIEKLKDARPFLPETPLYWLTYRKEPSQDILQKALDAQVDGINVNYGLVSDELVSLARENDLAFYVWTVNEPEMAKKLAREYKVDGITTDFPDKMERAVLAKGD